MCARGGAPGLSLVLLAAMSGCGSSSKDSTILPAPNWGAEYAAAACAKIFGCCDATERLEWNYADEAQCRQVLGTELQTNLSELLSIGWVSYDARAARQCVEEVAATACADLQVVGKSLYGPSCYLISRGTGEIGRVCEDLDVVCRSSNCDISVGTCGPTRGCSTVCNIDEYCDTTAQACAPWKADGEPCSATPECQPALVCRASGVCGRQLGGGAACNAADDCISGVCAAGTNGPACGPQICDGI